MASHKTQQNVGIKLHESVQTSLLYLLYIFLEFDMMPYGKIELISICCTYRRITHCDSFISKFYDIKQTCFPSICYALT